MLDAAAQLLWDGGLAAVTMDAVATAARVGKPTIYRRWPNRTVLAIDAFAERMEAEVPQADTGDIRADLAEQVARVARFYRSHAGQIFAQLLGEVTRDPIAANRLRERFYKPRRAAMSHLWQRAVASGEGRPDIDADTAIDALFGGIVFRLIVGHAGIGPKQVEALTKAALDGLLVQQAPARKCAGPSNT